MKDKIVYIIFAIIGTGLLVGDAYTLRSQWSFVEHSQKAQGMVTQMVRKVSNRKNTSDTFAPQVRFVLPDGSVHEFTSEVSSAWKMYSVGQPVKVLYDPAKPDVAEIDGFLAIWTVPLILGILGVTFSGIGYISLAWIIRRKRFCAYLLQNGIKIPATGGRVERDCSMRINKQCAWRIVCEADYNGERRMFKSDRIWSNPTEKIRDKQVTIAIDPNDPKKYCVDLSVLK